MAEQGVEKAPLPDLQLGIADAASTEKGAVEVTVQETEIDKALEKSVLRKFDWRILPAAVVMYLCSYVL